MVHKGTVHGELLTSISVEVSGKIVCEKEETNCATILSLSWCHSSRPIVTREITQLLLKSFLTVCIFKLKGKRDRLVLSWVRAQISSILDMPTLEVMRHKTSASFRVKGTSFGCSVFFGSFGWTSVTYDWSMVFKATIKPVISNACSPKWSQESLRRKLVPIPLTVSGVGNYPIFSNPP